MIFNPWWPYLRLLEDENAALGWEQQLSDAVIGGAVSYTLDDDFITAQSAPLITPRTCEPGPGQLTIVDPGNKLTIAASKLSLATGGVANGTYAGGAAIPFLAGRAFILGGANMTASGIRIGWTPSLGVSGMGSLEDGSYRNVQAGASVQNLVQTIDATPRTFALIRNADGGVWLIIDGVLHWWDESVSLAALAFYALDARSTTGVAAADSIKIVNLPGVWSQSHGIDRVNVTIPGSGVNQTATADAEHTVSFTLPGSPAANDKVELRFRIQDASNYDFARVIRNAGNTAWDVICGDVIAGVEGLTTTVTNVGTVARLRVRVSGTRVDVWKQPGGSTAWGNAAISNKVNLISFTTQVTINVTLVNVTASALNSIDLTTLPTGITYSASIAANS